MKQIALIFAFLAIVPMGCARPDPSYAPGVATRTIAVRDDEQQFNLYHRGSKIPLYCDMLVKGELLGFSRSQSGQLEAVAGRQVHYLEEGRYAWKRFPPPSPLEEIDRELRVTIALASLGLGLFLLMVGA